MKSQLNWSKWPAFWSKIGGVGMILALRSVILLEKEGQIIPSLPWTLWCCDGTRQHTAVLGAHPAGAGGLQVYMSKSRRVQVGSCAFHRWYFPHGLENSCLVSVPRGFFKGKTHQAE